MDCRILPLLFFLFLSPALFANNGDPTTVTLCNGDKMTWKSYLLYKEMRSIDYDIEIDYMSNKNFAPFKVNTLNNSVGAWSSVIQMPLVASAAANLPDGRIMTWSAKDKLSFGGNLGRTWTAVFDPSNNSTVDFLIEQTGHDMFCPGTATLPDGRIMVSGGSSSNRSSIYNPGTAQWNTGDEMKISRGYHSAVTLASGATFVIGGSWSGGVGGKDAEVWSEKTGWYQLPGVPVTAITDGIVSNQPVKHDDYFPWLWTAPNGKVLHAGPSSTMHWIDPTGTGSWTNAGQRGNDGYSISGTTVMYDVGKILKAGGAGTFEEQTNANNRTYVIDVNGTNPQVNQSGNLNYTRNYHSSVVLPNGEVMVIGGIPLSNVFSDANSRMVPEIWNPNTGQWTAMAEMDVPRNYHSIALLMMDGRVFSAGSGLCGGCSTNHPDGQIFSPPYLFNNNGTLATRPTINSAPTTAAYNSNILVNTNAGISTFSLVRMSSTTHSTNNDQRRIPLSKTNLGGNQYQLNIPNRNILPPGSYMLFAINNNGTPSIAKIITIGDDINDCTPLNNPDLGGTGLEGTYFNNSDLTNPILTRTDPTINFNWGTGTPANTIGAETFSIRWEGEIEVPRAGTYTFFTNSDDGVRLWVDNQLMVDNWTTHGPTEDIGMITLNANSRHQIKLEYFENTGGAVLQLRWTGPGIEKEIIPQGNLFPPNPCGANTGPCNDGDPCTINDTYNNNCNCVGTFQDSDNDGICNANDQCPGFDDNLIGSSCNDNDPNTINDIYQSDCTCAGTLLGNNPDCNDISITTQAGSITVNGIDGAPVVSVQIFSSTWQTVHNCFADCNSPTETVSVAPGKYFVYVKYYAANYAFICQEDGTYNVGNGGCTDNDNDGVCANADCDDNDANFPKAPGTACNDGNANTTNDMIQSDGCTCAGTNTGTGNCNDISISTGTGNISVSGLDGAPITHLQIFTPFYNSVFNCAGDCDPTESVNVPAGDYLIFVKYYTGNWQPICEVSDAVAVTGGGTGNGDCDDVVYTMSGNDLTVSGLNTTPVSLLQIFDASWQGVFSCAGNCNPTEALSNLPDGTYFVKTTLLTASWAPICIKEAYATTGVNGVVTRKSDPNFLFAAKAEGFSVDLNWISNTAFKNKAFDIERSSDGLHFESLQSIESNSVLKDAHMQYSTKDHQPAIGRNFYRIKKWHHDGSFEYSPVEEVFFQANPASFKLYPNPAEAEVFVNLKEFAGSKAQVSIYNNLGILMASQSIEEIGHEPLRFSTIDYPAGLYLVTVQRAGGKIRTEKLVIGNL